MMNIEKDNMESIMSYFEHIAQIANDRKNADGFVMKAPDALDEINIIAQEGAEYIQFLIESEKS